VDGPAAAEETAIRGSAVSLLIVLPVPALLLLGHLLDLLGRLM
jgi:hypothetical protein